MTAKNNKVLTSNPIERKEYSYTLGNTSLNFTLRSDVKEEMNNFIKLLEKATVDVKNQLQKLN